MCACDRTQDLIGVVPKCLKAEVYKSPLQACAFPTVIRIPPPFLDSYKIYYCARLQASQKSQRAFILHSQITRYHQTVPRACLEKCCLLMPPHNQLSQPCSEGQPQIAYAWRKVISHAYHAFKKVFFFLLFLRL